MLEVVFSDSEKGALRCAKHDFLNGSVGAISVIISGKRKPSKREYRKIIQEIKQQEQETMQQGKPLGGKMDDVIGLSFFLDMGPIQGDVTDSTQKRLLFDMLCADPYYEYENLQNSANQYWENCLADLEKLLVRVHSGEAIRIWYSNLPYSLCGFYDTVSRLEGCPCPITAIKLPDWVSLKGCSGFISSWAEVDPGAFASYLPLETELSVHSRKEIASQWRKLKQEDAPLRCFINGKLQSVAEDFYDGFIQREIPDTPFSAAQLIGKVLCDGLGIGDWWIAQRIRQMVANGQLKVVQEKPAFYQTIFVRS